MLHIKRDGAGAVTAGDVTPVSGVRIVDPSHHILTLHDDRDLNIELYVNKGRGYVESDQHPLDRGLPVDLVRIDSIYNPVRRANFAVAETRVGQRTDYDRLTLTVETNGTITPGRGGELRRRAGADALPVFRRLRLARVGAGRRRRE